MKGRLRSVADLCRNCTGKVSRPCEGRPAKCVVESNERILLFR